MKSEEIVRILKEAANLDIEYKDGMWHGYGSIVRCPECKEMSYQDYCTKHYPAKKALLEKLPWAKVVERPRCPQTDEYPSEDGDYIVMLDCDEHAVLTNSFRNGHWTVYDKTHVKWWMPISVIEDQFEYDSVKQIERTAEARFMPEQH